MSGSYIAIAGVLLYFFLLRTLDLSKMNPPKAAVLLIVGYYGLLLLVLGLEFGAKDLPVLPNLLTPVRILTALLQFVAAVGIFYKAEESGDSYMSYLGWGAAGLLLIFYVLPILGQMLLGWL